MSLTPDDEPAQSKLNDMNQYEEKNSVTDSAVDADLSSIEPFGFEDVSVLGYPWGINAYELQDRGLLENVEISDDSGYLDIYHPDINTVSNSYLRYPTIGFRDNGLIQSVIVKDGDSTIGPRGSRIGMSMEATMHLFRCGNPEALEFARNLTPDVPDNVRPYDYFKDGMYYLSTIYPFGDGIRLEYDVYGEEQNAGTCQLIFNIHNEIVSSIEIYYIYE